MHLRTMSALAFLVVAAAANAADDKVTRYTQRDGTQVELHSGQRDIPASGPAPEFASLDANGDGSISADEANAYAALANDFIHADLNQDHRISKAEYAKWAAHP